MTLKGDAKFKEKSTGGLKSAEELCLMTLKSDEKFE